MGYDTALTAMEGTDEDRTDTGPGPDALGSHEAGAADPDVVEELADEIATLAAHLHAGTARLLALLARFDRLRGWEPSGHRSCAHWLAYRSGLDLGTAREHVRVARALAELPRTAEAMGRGALSFSQVRALTRVAEPESEADLLELAEGVTAAQLERLVRAWKKGSREDEAARERERHRSRTLSVFPDDDGMYVIQGRLDPEAGAALMRAVDAASDALYRDRRDVPVDADGRVLDSDREASRRRADAIALMAERALAAGFGSGRKGDASRAPISGTRAERYQVVLHVDPATLAADGDPGRSELEDGTRVSAETSRRLACDAGLVRLTRARAGPEGTRGALPGPVTPLRRGAPDAPGRGGASLDVGRRTRTIPPALRRALEARDRGCRFPGCGLRFTETHHVVHWADGGATSLDNTVLLSRYHHRLVHEEGWQVVWWRAGQPAFRDPRGSVHATDRKPASPSLPERSAADLARSNGRRGVRPSPWTAGARWKREADIPDRVLFRALEAAL